MKEVDPDAIQRPKAFVVGECFEPFELTLDVAQQIAAAYAAKGAPLTNLEMDACRTLKPSAN